MSFSQSSGKVFFGEETPAVVLRIDRFAPLPEECARGAVDCAIAQPIDFRPP